jgi:hypothetical protein
MDMIRKPAQWRKIRHVDPNMPSKHYCMMADSLPCKQASLLIQLHTGHAPLNKHLLNIKNADSPICPACEDAHKTVHHFLLSCPVYKQHWHHLFYTLNRGSQSLAILLAHPKGIKHLFKYISKTGRFKNTLGDLKLPDHPAARHNENNGGRNWILNLISRPMVGRGMEVGSGTEN